MYSYIKRNIENVLFSDLKHFPAVALLGPRQCGKSTLIKELGKQIENLLYLDLQSPQDLAKLEDPSFFFSYNKDKTICLDEIQNRSELFPVLRSVIDSDRQNGKFIILGSASRDLIKQSSESLAGRISYLELTPFLLQEIKTQNKDYLTVNWLRGGFPDSFLSDDDNYSMRWRINFIRTFLERDIPQLGFAIPSSQISRLWSMCAHLHSQVLNSSSLGESLGVSHHTIKKYLDILSQTFMLRLLPPFETNLKKRVVKSPKIYIRDSGILHALLDISDFNKLLGHPILGASWEGFVIENILSELPDWKGYFYRTAAGVEIDLILEKGLERIAVECKASTSPSVTKGFYIAMEDLQIKESFIIAPVNEVYKIKANVWVMPLIEFIKKMKLNV